jgi:hypothetical protein
MPQFGSSPQDGPPQILVNQTNPYGSVRLVVAWDGATTTAYLLDEPAGSLRTALWLANHVPAPPVFSGEDMTTAHAPLMPASSTVHPHGRDPVDPAALRVIWFEEGDGLALVEGAEALAVIPGWVDPAAGFPGFSRDAVGRTRLGWEFGSAIEALAARVRLADKYWTWRSTKDAWSGYQQTMLRRLTERLGTGTRYWAADGGRMPSLGVSEHCTEGADLRVVSTVGMSCQRMPQVERDVQDASRVARIELAMATPHPDTTAEAAVESPATPLAGSGAGAAPQLLAWLGQFPWRELAWLDHGHTVAWTGTAPFPMGPEYVGVLLLDDPTLLGGPEPPSLGGIEVEDDTVRWLWLVPLTAQEFKTVEELGVDPVVGRLRVEGRTWVSPIP